MKLLLLAPLFAAACGDAATRLEEVQTARQSQAPSPWPHTSQPQVHEQFLEDLATPRHPSDGGGTARLVLEAGEDGRVTAMGRGRWSFEYQAGPQGIAEGGSLLFLVSPFWGWSTPQSSAPERSGYTTVLTEAEGVELLAETADKSLLRILVRGRALVEGETISLVYGAGPGLAAGDLYAERGSRFWFKVDGDGDGVSELLGDAPAVDVHAGPPERLTMNLTSAARPGGAVRLVIAVLDGMANAGCEVEGLLRLESEPPGLPVPATVELDARDHGAVLVELEAAENGIFRVRATLEVDGRELEVLSNPLRVLDHITPVFWGDLHGHSGLSDGTGLPEDYFRYARDVAGLDVAVLTDHDHFGVRFLDAHPEMWAEIREQVQAFNEPGRFVALLGYEWTSWLYGHRHVLYFDGEGEVLSSIDEDYTTPTQLWEALVGREALTFAHHSAGAPVATDWSFVPDPAIEPVTEVVSVHGSSEASDSPSRVSGGIPGNYVRDQLDRGLRFGFVGSGDSHDGHPGHAHLAPNAGYRRARPDPRGRRADERMGNGGVAAIRAEALTPGDLLAGLRSRRVYATSGPRIWLATSLGGLPMGATAPLASLGEAPTFFVEVAGTAPIEHLDIIRRGRPIERLAGEGLTEFALEQPIEGLEAGDYLYVRVLQRDGAQAWSSPFYLE